jgi:hypothetical protein
MRGFFEAHLAGELLQLIATDDELTGLTVDVTEPSLPGDDAVEAARLYRCADVSSFTS